MVLPFGLGRLNVGASGGFEQTQTPQFTEQVEPWLTKQIGQFTEGARAIAGGDDLFSLRAYGNYLATTEECKAKWFGSQPAGGARAQVDGNHPLVGRTVINVQWLLPQRIALIGA